MPFDPMDEWTGSAQQEFVNYLRGNGQHELESFVAAQGTFAGFAAMWKRRQAAAVAAAPKPGPETACPHADLAAFVEVHPLSAEPDGPITSYIADVRIQCARDTCSEPFVFIGPGIGISPRHPMVSFNGQELRAPIRPAGAPAGWGEQGPGFGLSSVYQDGSPPVRE